MLVWAEENMFCCDHFVDFQPILGPLAMSAILGAGAGRGKGGWERGRGRGECERFCVRERVASCKRKRRKRDGREPRTERGGGQRHMNRHRHRPGHTDTHTDTDKGIGTDPGVTAIVAAIQRSKTEIVTGFSHEGARGADECTQQGEVACVLRLGLGFSL